MCIRDSWWTQPFIPFFTSQPDSAHCMRWNNGWWEAYDIHESHMDFEIIVTVNTTLGSNITQGTSTSTSNHTVSSLTLTPSRPKGVTEDRRVSAHLLGELSSYEAFPVLTSSKFLVRKAPGALHTLTSNDMMVVDNTMITLDGSECNKIGVGFTAFRYVLNHVLACDEWFRHSLLPPPIATDGHRSWFHKTAIWMESTSCTASK